MSRVRQLPRLLHRFNYWEFPEIRPEADAVRANQQQFARHGLDVSARELRDAEKRLRKREREAWSAAIRSRPAARLGAADVDDALLYRMLSDPQWASDRAVQACLSRLGPERRAVLARRARRRGVHDVPSLIRRIALDQEIWERSFVSREKLERVAERFNLDRRDVAEVTRHYNRQARKLQGLGAEFHGKALEEVRLAEAAGRCRLVGRRLIIGPRVCATDEELVHWFAHALRTLARWRQRHLAIPWSANCRDDCLAHRRHAKAEP